MVARTRSGSLEPETANAGARPDTLEPRLHGRERRLELEPESSEHHHSGREGGIGDGERVPDEVLLSVQAVAQIVETATQLLARLFDPLRIALALALAQLGEQHGGRRDE